MGVGCWHVGPATGPTEEQCRQHGHRPAEEGVWALLLWLLPFCNSETDKGSAALGCLGPYLPWSLVRLQPTPPLRPSKGSRSDSPSPHQAHRALTAHCHWI